MNANRHEHVIQALREGPRAPAGLRARVEAEMSRADERRRARGTLATRVALGSALAATILALVVLPALLGGAPSVADVHELANRGPTAGAPPRAAGNRRLLAASVDGVAFPDWGPELDWHAVGQRSDDLDGRGTKTVFYRHHGHLVGYTIVPGDPLDPPPEAKRHHAGGIDVYIYSDKHLHDIAVFERQGQTCVISGHVRRESTLVRLATWTGDGQVEV